MRKVLRLSPEHIVYLIFWALVFLMPLVICYLRVRIDPQAEFRWIEVFHIWRWFGIYLLLFLIHNYFLAPLLIAKKRVAYFSLLVAMVLAFTLLQGFSGGPQMRDLHPHWVDKGFDMGRQHDGRVLHRNRNGVVVEEDRQMMPAEGRRPQGFFLGPDVPVNILVLIGLLGLNVGVKFYIKSENDRANLQQLEKEQIYLQLQYLKFQINPHFFMNTLNNIQVLIDMDAEQAKASLRDLSVMMRYILYEGGRDWVPLQREADFLRNYIRLMRLRYTDRLEVTVDIPDNLPEGQMPPLVLATFVENAFKHGVSYRHDSFITVSMDVEDGNLLFTCMNSKKEEEQEASVPHEGGVGLSNVRRRLDLIYGQDYTLDIKDGEEAYDVTLRLPLHHETTA